METSHVCTDDCPPQHEVLPGLFVGSLVGAKDLATLRALGIRAILSVGADPTAGVAPEAAGSSWWREAQAARDAAAATGDDGVAGGARGSSRAGGGDSGAAAGPAVLSGSGAEAAPAAADVSASRAAQLAYAGATTPGAPADDAPAAAAAIDDTDGHAPLPPDDSSSPRGAGASEEVAPRRTPVPATGARTKNPAPEPRGKDGFARMYVDVYDMAHINVAEHFNKCLNFVRKGAWRSGVLRVVRGVWCVRCAACVHVDARASAATADQCQPCAPTCLASNVAHAHVPPVTELPHGGVLVHCVYGQSRSVAVVAAFMMRKARIALPAALAHIAGIRPCIAVNPGFLYQLQLYEALLVARDAGLEECGAAFSLYRLFDESSLRAEGGAPVAGFDGEHPVFVAAATVLDEPDADDVALAGPAAGGDAGDDTATAGRSGGGGGGRGAAAAVAAAGGGAKAKGATGRAAPKLPDATFSCAKCNQPLFHSGNVVPHPSMPPKQLRLFPRRFPSLMPSPLSPPAAGGVASDSGPAAPPAPHAGAASARAAPADAVAASHGASKGATPPALPKPVDGATPVPAPLGSGWVCRYITATEGETPRRCGAIYVEPMAWMSDRPGVPYEASGKLTCPNPYCDAKLGRYDWAGMHCMGCERGAAPAFAVERAKVKRRKYVEFREGVDRHGPAAAGADAGDGGAAKAGGGVDSD